MGEELMLLHLFEMQDRSNAAAAAAAAATPERYWRKPALSNPSGM
jgi:hypothetical protein